MGELNFMTGHYAKVRSVLARLTNADFFEARRCFARVRAELTVRRGNR
jgi:hypothetical protein